MGKILKQSFEKVDKKNETIIYRYVNLQNTILNVSHNNIEHKFEATLICLNLQKTSLNENIVKKSNEKNIIILIFKIGKVAIMLKSNVKQLSFVLIFKTLL